MSPLFGFLPAALIILLAGCASTPTPAPPAVIASKPEPITGPALRGHIHGAQAGNQVELALITLDPRGRPQRELSSLTLEANGQALPFALALPQQPQQQQRLELRARVSQSGRLVQTLPKLSITSLHEQQLGHLQLVPAP